MVAIQDQLFAGQVEAPIADSTPWVEGILGCSICNIPEVQRAPRPFDLTMVHMYIINIAISASFGLKLIKLGMQSWS